MTDFVDDIVKCIFLNEMVEYQLECHNKPAMVQIMAWHQPGDKLLSEPTMA